MFARHVTLQLRADSLTKFGQVMDDYVFPLLLEQDGFLDHTTLISTERVEAIVITFWSSKESEEAFNRTRNPEVLTRLLEVLEGTPKVDVFEVVSAGFRKTGSESEHEARYDRYGKKHQSA